MNRTIAAALESSVGGDHSIGSACYMLHDGFAGVSPTAVTCNRQTLSESELVNRGTSRRF